VGDRGRSGGNSRTVSGGERRSGSSSGGGGERARSGAGAPVNTSEGLIKSAGTTAFAGSVTRQARVKAVTGGPSRSKSKGTSTRPSERSAGADLWSGLASGKNPSLIAGANENRAPSTAKGAGLAVALGLLGVGFLTLLGLGVAEAQRRRSRASAR